MPWPTPELVLIGASETFTVDPATVSFDAQDAGTLLLAWYQSGFVATTYTPTAGWTLLSAPDGRSRLYAKVSDGTETSLAVSHDAGGPIRVNLDVLAATTSATLSGFGNRLDAAASATTGAGGFLDAPDLVAVGVVSTRLDFARGKIAPGSAPVSGDPEAVVLAARNGQAFQLSGSVYGTPLGVVTPGTSIIGATFGDDVTLVVSVLLRLRGGGWRINRLGFG